MEFDGHGGGPSTVKFSSEKLVCVVHSVLTSVDDVLFFVCGYLRGHLVSPKRGAGGRVGVGMLWGGETSLIENQETIVFKFLQAPACQEAPRLRV